MKIFHVCMIIGCGVAIAPLAAMGSKSKPATEVREPKVLPESTKASAPSCPPETSKTSTTTPAATNTQAVKLIENTSDANQKVHDEMTSSMGESVAKADGNSDGSKKAKKSSNKKAGKAKKAAGKKTQSKKK